jgi:hypothetical protein
MVIKSENAAKPASQKSAYCESIIRALPSVKTTFDYGCGKLRYLDVILNTTEVLVIVDSEIQLTREQQLLGNMKRSIRDAYKGVNRVAVLNSAEFRVLDEKFDRGFCLNVLPCNPH